MFPSAVSIASKAMAKLWCVARTFAETQDLGRGDTTPFSYYFALNRRGSPFCESLTLQLIARPRHGMMLVLLK